MVGETQWGDDKKIGGFIRKKTVLQEKSCGLFNIVGRGIFPVTVPKSDWRLIVYGRVRLTWQKDWGNMVVVAMTKNKRYGRGGLP